jgi:hypothetical protein
MVARQKEAPPVKLSGALSSGGNRVIDTTVIKLALQKWRGFDADQNPV